MPINSFLYPGAKTTLAYEVANSLRFEDGNNDHLVKNFGTPTNQYKYTISMWVKRSLLGSNQTLFGVGDDASNNAILKFENIA